MAARVPILLSYYALSNGTETMVFGQVTGMRESDLSFTAYTRRRTFRTLVSLYRTKPIAKQEIIIEFNDGSVTTTTDASGFFFLKDKIGSAESVLQTVTLSSGAKVIITEGLYTRAIHYVDSASIIVSDIDDTILHSYISKSFRKFRTLMFTPVEKRKAVDSIKNLITSHVQRGATAIYLSNSEQNLYPLIYRFLTLNKFPTGPLFLKQIRKLWDVIRYRKLPAPEVHKIKMLNQIIPMFSNKKFILVGDNTQRDLSIYTETAEKYPGVIDSVFIRKVVFRSSDDDKITAFRERLSKAGVNFFYDDEFPSESY